MKHAKSSLNQAGVRRLKVYSKTFNRAFYRNVTFPEIRLCGKWLEKMGFDCGGVITVAHAMNRITITAETIEESEATSV